MPLLVVVEPLLELRIERQGLLAWQQLAPPGRPFRAPLAWPLAPIAPGEVVVLRLRPEQAAEGSFAQVQLVGADAERMARTAALIHSLGQRPPAWLAAIETALEAGDVSLAWALLFDPPAPCCSRSSRPAQRGGEQGLRQLTRHCGTGQYGRTTFC